VVEKNPRVGTSGMAPPAGVGMTPEMIVHDNQCERQWGGAPSWAQDLRGFWCRCSWRAWGRKRP